MGSKEYEEAPRHPTVLSEKLQLVLDDPPPDSSSMTNGVVNLIADMVEKEYIDRRHKPEVGVAIAEQEGVLQRKPETMLAELLMKKILQLLTSDQVLRRVIDVTTEGARQLILSETPRRAPMIHNKVGMRNNHARRELLRSFPIEP